MKKRWSILILHMPARRALLDRLLEVLRPQVDAHHEEIELMIMEFVPFLPVGENRELMKQKSCGEYVNFIDDDDLVAEDYVEKILPQLGTTDYVGFNLEQKFVDAPQLGCIERHSLRYNGVYSDGTGSYDGHFRDISHLNPMRRDLSLRVAMEGWPAEDSRWAERLRALRCLKTEVYLDEVLYTYLTRTVKPEMANV